LSKVDSRRQAGGVAQVEAVQLALGKEWLKINIRKLKELGLTESLAVGYRVSPHGEELVWHATRGGP